MLQDCTKPPSKKSKTRKSSYNREAFYQNPKCHYSRNYSSRTPKPTPKPETISKPPLKDVTCFKCGKKGHMSSYCLRNRQIKELHLKDDTVQKIQALLIKSSESNSPLSSELKRVFKLIR